MKWLSSTSALFANSPLLQTWETSPTVTCDSPSEAELLISIQNRIANVLPDYHGSFVGYKLSVGKNCSVIGLSLGLDSIESTTLPWGTTSAKEEWAINPMLNRQWPIHIYHWHLSINSSRHTFEMKDLSSMPFSFLQLCTAPILLVVRFPHPNQPLLYRFITCSCLWNMYRRHLMFLDKNITKETSC